jgi:PAS domain S-box-containing protein
MSESDRTKEQLILEIERLRNQLCVYEQADRTPLLTQEKLKTNSETWQVLENLTDDFLMVITAQGEILHANMAAEKKLGYLTEDFRSLSLFDLYLSEHGQEAWNLINAAVSGEVSFNSIPLRSKAGRIIPVETRISAGVWEGRNALFCLFRDITRQKRAEIEINMLSNALRCINECLIVFDLEGTIIFVNEMFLRTYGYQKNELIGKSINLIHSGKNPAELIGQIISDSVKNGWYGEVIDLRKDGLEFTSFLKTTAVQDEAGRPLVIIGVSHDLTERKHLEDQLRQSQKMEAIGQLAGGIAHDFNNLLTVIDGYVELLTNRLPENIPQNAWVNQIKRASERAGSLTRQLLAFSRRQILQPRLLDLNQLVREMSILLKRLIGEDVEFTTALHNDIGQIKADSSQIEQVLMNLVVNARDAMPEGGQLTIGTRRVNLDSDFAMRHPGVTPGSYVQLSVSDTGIGMAPEVQEHIFEPFYTTKEKGKGTGLGLATVYGIVAQSGGYIWVYSEIGKGTSFKIFLPCLDEALPDSADHETEKIDIRGHETILVVEDEFMVRELVSDTLRTYGYTVLEASNGKIAQQVFEQSQQVINLVLTDVVMPGMSGRKLIEMLAMINPKVKALYMSGYTDEAIQNHRILEPGMSFLQKPFTPTVLAKKVREVLLEQNI